MSAQPEPAARPYGRRADAERNHESVLDQAVGLLAEDPTVGMAEIAAAAGIGRATLYRHFPTREDLLAAIDARAVREIEQAIADSQLERGPATVALRRLIGALLEIGDRYRFLLSDGADAITDEQRRERKQRLRAPLFALIERGQASGEFSRALTPAWILTVFGAVLVAATREIAAGRLDRDHTAEIVAATLLHGCVGRRASAG